MKIISIFQIVNFFAFAIKVGAAAMPNPSHYDLARRDSSPSPSDGSFQNLNLSYINNIRGQHRATALIWDDNLAVAALRKANGCRVDHSGPHGENAFSFWQEPAPSSTDWTAKTRNAIDSWAKEKALYNSGRTNQAYHFTQLVWKGSSRIGCAWTAHVCQGNAHKDWWFYCDFDPRGNVLGHFTENVTG
ncbi:hypothetical protein E2P81_ATG05678 [Venturia nashicola]|uniref:SCP domain-containing protein n=1 Tax=Venturia nashicola TaxID=86259 RepID=A0A4Z1P3D5_9PEZI|nr:hypothetical protein E6O75_ATG05816 [Venturia nashicola]TLD29384.1 hypothetical protein E2P81_ATG05678 [Venturia nashicola]